MTPTLAGELSMIIRRKASTSRSCGHDAHARKDRTGRP